MNPPKPPVACDLGALGADERDRERELLARFRGSARAARRESDRVRYELPADAATLAAVGELLAYERRCCPFLAFRLTVDATDGAVLEVSGDETALDLVLAEFGDGRPRGE